MVHCAISCIRQNSILYVSVCVPLVCVIQKYEHYVVLCGSIYMQDFARNLDSQVCSSESDVMGKPISSKDIELLNDSQMLQLSELHKEASKPPSDT